MRLVQSGCNVVQTLVLRKAKISSLGLTQNLSGFGIEVYKNFKKESDGGNYVSYIEKSSREKKLEVKTI